MVGGAIILGIWFVLIVWRYATPSGQRWSSRVDAEKKTRAPKVLSTVGAPTVQGLACPKCGGTQFTAHRSGRGKVTAGLLARKSRVRCVTCGTDYLRG